MGPQLPHLLLRLSDLGCTAGTHMRALSTALPGRHQLLLSLVAPLPCCSTVSPSLCSHVPQPERLAQPQLAFITRLRSPHL